MYSKRAVRACSSPSSIFPLEPRVCFRTEEGLESQTGNGMCFGKGASHPTHSPGSAMSNLTPSYAFVRIFLLVGKIIHGGMRH